jgi:hypothetical protein
MSSVQEIQLPTETPSMVTPSGDSILQYNAM